MDVTTDHGGSNMKRTLTNFVTFIFLGFLLLGGICIVQNLVQEIEKSISPKQNSQHILAYESESC
jgi:hypothetical protein